MKANKIMEETPTLKRTREVSNLTTSELLCFLWELQYLYNPYFSELRKELTMRSLKTKKVFHYKNYRWKRNVKAGGGWFVKDK
jgi:hypothetical protein